MRTAAKVFVIIGMIGSAIALGAIFMNLSFSVLPIAFGILALKQIGSGDKPSVVISILTLIFCSPLGGIFMLCIPEEYSRSPANRCDQCGIMDYSVHHYTVNNYLGRVNRYLCPRCASALDTNTPPRGICEECRSNNPDLQFYTVTVGESKVNKRLCPACRARHEAQRRSINK